MSDLLKVSSSPHVRAKDDTTRIMLYVILALMPTTIFGVFNFGLRALILVAVCIVTCVISEFLFEKAVGKKSTVGDLSAVVTGLLLALNLPFTLPYWQAVLGSIFAIVIVKMLFGGLGQNFMNPALGGRVFLVISFAATMTHFEFDGVAEATPLAVLKSGEAVNTLDMLIGRTGGTIGETSAICILIGAIILILLGVIDLTIPGFYICSFIAFLVLFGGHGWDSTFIVAHLCGGGLMLGAFFMATDYVTSPITPMGKVLFGICLGVLTGVFRIFGNSAEGVSFAIIFSNLLVPLIEKVTVPRAFGITRTKKPKEVKANE
ncbi:MAG: RnfABCDGE type electron transport complex subunit D [Pseudobutyrivibrio sp.]|nr:RnfABCDGE type electron transport complex subunit D [Pseudobutyrivibrio sp.]